MMLEMWDSVQFSNPQPSCSFEWIRCCIYRAKLSHTNLYVLWLLWMKFCIETRRGWSEVRRSRNKVSLASVLIHIPILFCSVTPLSTSQTTRKIAKQWPNMISFTARSSVFSVLPEFSVFHFSTPTFPFTSTAFISRFLPPLCCSAWYDVKHFFLLLAWLPQIWIILWFLSIFMVFFRYEFYRRCPHNLCCRYLFLCIYSTWSAANKSCPISNPAVLVCLLSSFIYLYSFCWTSKNWTVTSLISTSQSLSSLQVW